MTFVDMQLIYQLPILEFNRSHIVLRMTPIQFDFFLIQINLPDHHFIIVGRHGARVRVQSPLHVDH